jgi:hypothetical protein
VGGALSAFSGYGQCDPYHLTFQQPRKCDTVQTEAPTIIRASQTQTHQPTYSRATSEESYLAERGAPTRALAPGLALFDAVVGPSSMLCSVDGARHW